MEKGTTISVGNLHDFVVRIFKTAKLSDESSAIVTDNLISSNLRGVDSHGVGRVPIYMKRLKLGSVNPNPDIKIIKENDATLLIDGDNGMGAVVGKKAMGFAIEKAKASGGAFVGVTRSNHYGSGSFYVLQGVASEMVSFAYSNSPSTMAPWGGQRPYLGTNPYSFGIPAGAHPPIILDMATSVVARGRIILAAQKGEKIPIGWAVDVRGQPTDDAREALKGSVLPFAGPKGYGISLMIDIMCGVLTGAGFGPHVNNIYGDFDRQQNVGHFFKVVDVNTFMPILSFKERVDMMIEEIKSSPKAEGVNEIYLPGEIEYRNEKRILKEGICLNKEVFDDLKIVGEDCGIDIGDFF